MRKAHRIFFRKWFLDTIEYYFWKTWFWCMLEWWWYEDQDLTLHIRILFFEAFITFRKKVKTVFVYWSTETKDLKIEYKQRSFGFFIDHDCITIWYWKPWQWLESETTNRFYWYNIRIWLLWKKKFTKSYNERKYFEIEVQDLYEDKMNIHTYQYRYETRIRKDLLKKDVRHYTDVEVIGNAPKFPGKWTCGYNLDDDSVLWFSMKWFTTVDEIKEHIIETTNKYRKLYPL